MATPHGPSAEYVAKLTAVRAARGLTTPAMDARGMVHAELMPALPASDWAPDTGWTWDACVEALARLLVKLPPKTRSLTQARYRRLIPGTGLPWPATLQRAVDRENQRRGKTGLAANLKVSDLWDAASRYAVLLRANPALTEEPLRFQRLSREEVACKFACVHRRWPRRKELERFAASEHLAMRPRRGGHGADLARAKARLARNDAPLAKQLAAAEQQARLEPAGRARERQAAARIRSNARRRAKRREGPRKPRGGPVGVAIDTAIADFADEQGAYPSANLLRYWARALRGMSLAFPTRPYGEDLNLAARTRRREGEPRITTRVTIADKDRLKPVSPEPPVISKRRKHWPTAEVLAAVPRVAAEAADGERLTPAVWIRITRGHGDLPSISTLRFAVREVHGTTVSRYLEHAAAGDAHEARLRSRPSAT